MAALLHDVGKTVVPRRVLDKPTALTDEEAALVARCRRVGWDVVRHKMANPQVLEIVSQAGTWFDGTRGRMTSSVRDLPLGSRMLAIVDAFDAMTSNHAYRPALSRDLAYEELLRCAGSQFDPELARHFTKHDVFDPQLMHEVVNETQRVNLSEWLLPDDVCHDAPNRAARGRPAPRHSRRAAISVQPVGSPARCGDLHRSRTADYVLESRCSPHDRPVGGAGATTARGAPPSSICAMDAACGSATTIARYATCFRPANPGSGSSSARGPSGRHLTVGVQVAAVPGPNGRPLGAALIMRDLSPEESLRDHCHTLQRQVTIDALTGVANRSAFDRAHEHCVAQHKQSGAPYSLILCDIDHFKLVNDTFGHPAGDEALRRFARILESQCRKSDLVARYGGEEFAILCPDCSLPAARSRAEAVRQFLAKAEQSRLGGRRLTASFGVTSLLPGETAAEVLNRSDRALYEAKLSGRNCVVALFPPGESSADDIVSSGAVDRGANRTNPDRTASADSGAVDARRGQTQRLHRRHPGRSVIDRGPLGAAAHRWIVASSPATPVGSQAPLPDARAVGRKLGASR